ncbi:tripartite motif-containing protein 16 isoform X1 [Oncorhynchus mykiss]|uniref:Fish virus induced TRIM protein n=1 Tax=Oncorhynchus mykiss TaxID=8022 RepID=A0A8C7LQC1_ONCMY|nr:tripartite motif-containing protein 16 isoform X1 [Oncorhynchus mykiss]
MAESYALFGEDQFSCSICLDLLKNPVTIPCGHSYCMGCIKDYWDLNDRMGVYVCPQCRQTFTPRPALSKNTMFAEVVERLKKIEEFQADPNVLCYAKPGDIECDVCGGRKQKAIKSCLLCLASYCETHLKLHDKLNPGKRHTLVEASIQLQEKICSQHDKLLEVYCRTDQRCICYECLMGVHKGHETVSAAAEGTAKQKELKETHRKYKQIIARKEKELLWLKQAMRSLTYSAQIAVEDSDKVFTEIICSVEKWYSDVKRLIRSQEKAAVGPAEEQVDQLQREIIELRRRDTELEQLSKTEDFIIFLQRCQSVPALPGYGDTSSINVSQQVSFEGVKKTVAELKQRLEDFCEGAFANISKKVQDIHILQASKPCPPLPQVTDKCVESKEPTTREEFLKYACQLTLDQNTAHKNLLLSKDNKVAGWNDFALPYPDHPDRFDNMPVVLCREALTGRCYWEVEWDGIQAIIAVSYKGINRKKKLSPPDAFSKFLEFYDQSWSLDWNIAQVCENKKQIQLTAWSSRRIGLFLDHKAGTLAFYNIADKMTLIYRVKTTFTQPLYPAFWIKIQSKIKLCPLK